MNSKELKKYREEIKRGWFAFVGRSYFVDKLMWEAIYRTKDEITKQMHFMINIKIEDALNMEQAELKIEQAELKRKLIEVEKELVDEQF